MRHEALVDSEEALCAHGLGEAVEDALVEVSVLVVHARHDGVRGVHDAAHHEPAGGAAGQVQHRALLHAEVLDEPPLGEEIRRQLHAGAEARAHHCGRHAAV